MKRSNLSPQNPVVGTLLQRVGDLDLTKTHNRVLIVLETIGYFGPINIGELEKILPISRAAIWRTATSLREFGWVRMRIGDNALELTFAMDDFAANAVFSLKEISEFEPLFDIVTSNRGVTFQFACIERLGHCRLVEHSKSVERVADHLSILDDDLAHAALAALPDIEAARHIRHHIQHLSDRSVESSAFDLCQGRVNMIRADQILWELEDGYFCLPLRSSTAMGCAIRVSLKAIHQCGQHRLKMIARDMQRLLNGPQISA